MRGTRRTIVTAAASFAVVLGVGGVAAANGTHGWSGDSSTTTSVGLLTNRGGQHPRGRALGVRKQQEVTSTTAAGDTTTTTVADTTSTTVEDTTTTTVADTSTTMPTTSTTVAGDHRVCDDHGKHDGEADNDDDANETEHDGQQAPAQTTRADSSSHHGSHGGHGEHGGRG
jgi:hypothetical protein